MYDYFTDCQTKKKRLSTDFPLFNLKQQRAFSLLVIAMQKTFHPLANSLLMLWRSGQVKAYKTKCHVAWPMWLRIYLKDTEFKPFR